jgi:hypothetical protein
MEWEVVLVKMAICRNFLAKNKLLEGQGKRILLVVMVLYMLFLMNFVGAYSCLATGGNITSSIDGKIVTCIHTFLANGTFNTNGKDLNTTSLIVAGGGGSQAGGGGAGGLIYNTSYNVNGVYNVIVGIGGARGFDNSYRGYNGTNSTFGLLDAKGGGGGGASDIGFIAPDVRNQLYGADGGSGGGAGVNTTGESNYWSGNGINGQGFGGGTGYNVSTSPYVAGGGGGSAQNGTRAFNYNASGNGGNGTLINITGTPTYYAGGGGGGVYFVGGERSAGLGGLGGGGNGSIGGIGQAGINGTGGGAGGGKGGTAGGNSGGTGIVIIKYSFDNNVIFNSETYRNPTTSGSLDNFILDINVSAVTLTSAYFYYNNTIYNPSINIIDNNVILSQIISIPITNTVITAPFNWVLNFNDSSTYNSTSHNQTINAIGIDNCTTMEYKVLNMTLVDEKFQSYLNNNNSIEITMNFYPVGSSIPLATFSRLYNNSITGAVCMNKTAINNNNYTIDYQIKYSSDNYVYELYNIQNYLLTNLTGNVNLTLFDLASAQSTEFQVTYKDSSYIPVNNAIILIKRKYISEGVYKDVEAPLTDRDGQAIVHLDRSGGVVYTIYVMKNGAILSIYNDVTPICQDYIIGQCQIGLNALSSLSGIIDFSTYKNINYSMNFNSTSRKIKVSYFTTDGSVASVVLNASSINNATLYCSSSIFATIGNLECTIPSNVGNMTTVLGNLYLNNEIVTSELYTIISNPIEVFGYDGIVLIILLLMIMPLMFISSLVGMIIITILGLIMGGVLMIINNGDIFSTSSAIIWLIIAGGIIIWKITKLKEGGGD